MNTIMDDNTEKISSFNHSYVCSQILRQLFQNQSVFPMAKLTLDIGNGLTPDISIYPVDSVHPNLFRDIPKFSQMPILAVEIVSANHNVQDLLEKAAKLVQAGVKTVWTIEPFSRTIFITNEKGDALSHSQSLEVGGITVDFKRIFS